MRQAHMHYNHLDCNVYSDTFFSDVKSLQGDMCTQMFTTDFGFKEVYPMKTKADAYDCLNQFCTMYGVAKHIVVDNATIPESTLSKKHNSIAYHKCKECVASHAM
jgi:hypothetical protein